MKKMIPFLTAAVLTLGGVANATTFDFESLQQGKVNNIQTSDFLLNFTGGNGYFDIVRADPGPPVSGNAIISYFSSTDDPSPFRVTFNGSVSSFQIGVGDYNADVDNSYLRAFDVLGNVLASDYYQNPESTMGGSYLSVASSTPIKYVEFWDEEPYPGAVYWDNMTYEPVPEPSTVLLLGAGLAGLAVARKRRKNA